MTAQISDRVFYQEQEFSITAINGSGLYNPQQDGISPTSFSTACYRGYVCIYKVFEEYLYLKQLNIGLKLKDRLTAKYGKGLRLFDINPKYNNYDSSVVYEEINKLIYFSGGLLLGKDFIGEMYVHLGHHPAYKFQEVYELIFAEGKLAKSTDISQKIAEFRGAIATHESQSIIEKLITETKYKDEFQKWTQNNLALNYKM
ncbi:hypothetical protein I8752_20180 [Nostocaceae cyanobacterium CENA369]|uniref:Uncharacterized protein n=1 Tax=Dendronalium phyllosphericum CENA369 TaxID=1725256 RepID=A0A8J7LEU0_9NOST|nr:hypothetical protein [Dendronalium phyllosphericum]MBH8575287.1 hypothetical protein [Dendronalium phyllosphericum CENA369]